MMRPGLKQIVAMGGGGFSMEPENPLLDRYILGLAKRERPKVCFLGTASGDAQGYIDRFYNAFRQFPCKPVHLSLFTPPTADLRSFLLDVDIVYVGGGNTRNLLVLWKEWGVDNILKEAWSNGVVLSGLSTGSICWFEQGVTDSIPGTLTSLTCLGFLRGSNCPHYDGETERRPAYHRLMQEGSIGAGMASDDGVALHYVGQELVRIVSSHPDAKAYKVTLENGRVSEVPIDPEYLGGHDLLIRRASVRDARGIHDAHMRSIRELCSRDYTPEQIAAWGGREYNEEIRVQTIEKDYVWVVENHGSVAGFGHFAVSSHNEDSFGVIMGLYLTPEVIGKGLGRKILVLMEARARELKFKRIELKSTFTALAFYKSQGYAETGPETHHMVGGVAIPCIPLSKDFG